MTNSFLYRLRFVLATAVLLAGYLLFHNQLMNLYHCPFHSITGLYCPGCGGLRAVDSLLKFDFANALRYNPLVVAFIPLFLLGLNRSIRDKFLKAEFIKIKFPLVLLCLLICFGVLRNIFPL